MWQCKIKLDSKQHILAFFLRFYPTYLHGGGEGGGRRGKKAEKQRSILTKFGQHKYSIYDKSRAQQLKSDGRA